VTVVNENVNLRILLQSLYHVTKENAIKKKLDFSYDFDSHLPLTTRTDRTKINQIITNLLSNAIKFTKPGDRVRLAAKKVEDEVVFEVSDTGEGMSEEDLKNLRFAFEDTGGFVPPASMGGSFGLAISRQLVELLGGSLSVESIEGGGSTFRVTLPIVLEAVDIESDVSSEVHLHFSEKSKVLIVEDNPVNQEMLLALLGILGIKDVRIESDGMEAVTAVADWWPDVVLMDLHLPSLDGIGATRAIRNLDGEVAGTPVIILSADHLKGHQEKAEKAGVGKYLMKPVDVGQLEEALAQYLTPEKVDPKVLFSGKIEDRLNSARGRILACLEEILEIPIFHGAKVLEKVTELRNIVKKEVGKG